MDRVSAFGDEETVELLRSKFVPAAVSLQEELRAPDGAGEFFRKVADQRPEPRHSKQGYYIATPDGKLLKGWMYPRPDDGTLKRLLKEHAASYRPPPEPAEAPAETRLERRVERALPGGAAVLEVRSKVSDAEWPASAANRFDVVKGAGGHDRVWVLKEEIDALAQGRMPDSLLERIARFHLGDNTRCILMKWAPDAIRQARARLKPAAAGYELEGGVVLEQGPRGYEAGLQGRVEVRDGALRVFDVVAHGRAWGRHNGVPFAPLGKFTLTIGFRVAPAGAFDALPVLNWDEDYLRTRGLRVTELNGK